MKVRTLLALTALLVLAPASAGEAATRYVSTTGTAGENPCTDPQAPCEIHQAVNNVAANGDVVQVAAGTYDVTVSSLQVPAGVEVRGAAGARPLITSTGDVALALNSGSALVHIEVQYGGAGNAISASAARVDDAVVHATAGGTGVSLNNSVIRSSAIFASATLKATPGGLCIDAVGSALHHVTAIAGGNALQAASNVTATNSILRGGNTDILIQPSGTLDSDHNAYRPAKVVNEGALIPHGGDIATDPSLSADGHELAGSPTIDAGGADANALATDIDQQARTIGTATDIGADEYQPPPPPEETPTPSPTPQTTPQPSPTPSTTPAATVTPGPFTPPLQPELLGTTLTPGPSATQVLVIRARDANGVVNGVVVHLADGTIFAESACNSRGTGSAGDEVVFTITLPAGATPTAVDTRSGGCGSSHETKHPLATAASARSAASCAAARSKPSARNARKLAAAVLCLMNAARAAAGLKPLVASARLSKAAKAHTKDMVKRHFYAHQRPGGPTLGKRLSKARWRGATSGENLGLGGGTLATPQAMLLAWLKSPPHRANILSKRFKATGIVIAARSPIGSMRGAGLYTVDFGSKP